jgi:hypothetical protein
MTKKTVFGLLIISLLSCGGCSKKNNDPNDLEKVKAENDALKAKIQQLETANAEWQKKSQQLAQTKVAVEPNVIKTSFVPTVTVKPNIPPIPKKETKQLEEMESGIADLRRIGFIRSIDFERKEVSINYDMWVGFTVEEKKMITEKLATYFELKTGTPFITLLNSRSSTKLAGYGVMGPKLYE